MDNPNVQCTLYINVFWIAIFPHSLNLNTKKSDKKGRCFEMQLRRGPDSAVSVSFLSRGPQPRFLHFKPFQFLISHWQPGSRLRPRAHLRHSIFFGNFSHLEEIYQLRMVLICKKIIGKLTPSITINKRCK